MNVTVESYGHAVLLNLKGDLTVDSLNAFKQVVSHQLEGKEVVDLVLNLETVPFIDSAAMEYLLDLQDQLAQNLGRVRLVKPDENVRCILEITRLSSTFEIYDDVQQAVQVVGA